MTPYRKVLLRTLSLLTLLVYISIDFTTACAAEQGSESIQSEIRELGRLQATSEAQAKLLDALELQQAETAKSVQEAKNYLIVLSALLGVGIFAVVAYARSQLRKRLDAAIASSNERLDSMRKEFVGEFESQIVQRLDRHEHEVSKVIERAVVDTEAKSYAYIRLATLRYQHLYDEALAAAAWKGDPKVYERYPEEVQRHLIACLTKAQSAKASGDNIKAWDWVISLVLRSPTGPNVEAMLRTAKELRHSTDAVSMYDKFAGSLTTAEQVQCEHFLIVILRKAQSDSQLRARLRKLVEKHRDSKDMRAQTTIAAVYRDWGLFDDAESIMREPIRRLTGLTPREEGWDKLFNTYIANCIDLGKPADAVRQVKTLLASFNRPDHVFNCARVAWRLPKESEERRALFTHIQNRFADGLMPERDDGTVKTLAFLKENDGDLSGAERVLRQAIEDTRNNGNTAWAQDQSYFYHCTLAELFLGRGDAASIDRAVDALADAAATDRVGEARYLLARALIRKDEFLSAKRNLEGAVTLRPKWIHLAKRCSDFDRLPGFDALVSQYTVPLPE